MEKTGVIFIIDNDLASLEGMAFLLRTLNYCTHSYQSPLKAFCDLENNPPEMVIVDYAMEELDGITLSKQILEIKPDMPILMVSAHSNIEFKEMAIQAGVRGWLDKPVELSEIIDYLEQNDCLS